MDKSPAVWARGITQSFGEVVANGYFPVRTSTGDTPNHVWQSDGNVDLLASTTKE